MDLWSAVNPGGSRHRGFFMGVAYSGAAQTGALLCAGQAGQGFRNNGNKGLNERHGDSFR